MKWNKRIFKIDWCLSIFIAVYSVNEKANLILIYIHLVLLISNGFIWIDGRKIPLIYLKINSLTKEMTVISFFMI